MKASGLRNFRYTAFPPMVFEAPARAVEEAVVLPDPSPGEPEWVLAPENTLPAPPEPAPALPPLAPHAEPETPAPVPPVTVPPVTVPPVTIPAITMPAVPPAWTRAAPEPIPDPPSWSQSPVRPASGLRLLSEAAAAAAPPPVSPKPPGTPPRFALLDEISTDMRPRRARTGRRKPGDVP